MMSILVYNDALSFGAVSLYAGRGECFDADDVAVGHALAGHLAVVMTSGRQIDQLGLALNSRTLIGQATGLVMGRFSIDAATGVITVADASLLDYETATSHTVTVQATSSDVVAFETTA